jgi:hypothetical protein
LEIAFLPITIPFNIITYFINIPYDFILALVNAAKSKVKIQDKHENAK